MLLSLKEALLARELKTQHILAITHSQLMIKGIM